MDDQNQARENSEMKKQAWIGLFISIGLILSGCGAGEETASTKKEEKSTAYSVKDDRGEEVTFKKVPETVVSLQPSNTEILYAVGAGDKVVGVTEFDHYPKEVEDLEVISDSMTVNTEKVISLDPDVVIAYTTGDEAGVKQLEDAGIPVFVIQSAQTFDDVYGDIEQVAKVMGAQKKGNEVIEGMKKQISDVGEKVKSLDEKEKVYFEISPAPEIYTAGSATFQQEILQAAGVDNVFADQEGWPKLGEEEIIKRNPATILTTVNYVENPVDEIKSRTGWDTIDAVKGDRVIYLDSDVMSRPGPRISEAVEITAKAVYPDLF